jgi:hypothetical protein
MGQNRSCCLQEVEALIFQESAQECVKVVSLTQRPPLPPGNIPGTYFCQRLRHSASRSIIAMKNSSDTTRNRTQDVPACRAMPQPAAPLGTPKNSKVVQKFKLGGTHVHKDSMVVSKRNTFVNRHF